jgi:hypothetical protein
MNFVYAIKRGKRALYRQARAHLAVQNFGGALCGARTDVTSNVPWGLKTCKHCARLATRVRVVIDR